MSYRVLFLADADSSHTRKWAVSLHQRGYDVMIFSLRKSSTNWFSSYGRIKVMDQTRISTDTFGGSSAGKISYLRTLRTVKNIIRDFKPDLLHAHYATSYGLLGVLSGFHPLIISVWGSDVYDFPRRSFLHKTLLKRNLMKADAVLSTSECMKQEVMKLGRKDVLVTPFGVDTRVFCNYKVEPLFTEDTKVIGVIKSLEPAYGIDVLIRAFAKVRPMWKGGLKLVICGAGSLEISLKKLASSLPVSSDIVFKGAIPQEKVPDYLNGFDIFANLSLQESFGVAAVEAMSVGLPVVVSDAPGLMEITDNGKYGKVVKAGSEDEAARAILELLENEEMARKLGQDARAHVIRRYDWEKNLDQIEEIYRKAAAR